MPQRTYRFPSLITRFVLMSLASVALAVLRPRSARSERVQAPPRRRSGLRRVAVSFSFATLFFAGAAFSAGAGDLVVGFVEQQAASAEQSAAETAEGCPAAKRGKTGDGEDFAEAAGCETEDVVEESTEAPAEEAPAEAPADAAAEAPAPEGEPAVETPVEAVTDSVAAAAETAVESQAAPAAALSGAVRAQATEGKARRPAPKDDGAPPVLKPETRAHTSAGKHEPELDDPHTAATIWLQRAMPDPTPPSKRLTQRFAKNLVFASRKHGVHWSTVLGVLRARGHRESVPATKAGLDRLAGNLARRGVRRDEWTAVLSLEGRTAFADRAVALAQYHRAVGLKALVRGLEWARPLLTKRLLRDQRVSIYSGGRADLLAGRIDVRVIVLVRFLAEAHKQVTVTSLESGHRLFSRPGVVSAHIYGLAVDIAALEGQVITGSNQQPGSVTERAVRNMLLLPAEVRPVQVISLLGLGGPSFPMENHHDHIHAGF